MFDLSIGGFWRDLKNGNFCRILGDDWRKRLNIVKTMAIHGRLDLIHRQKEFPEILPLHSQRIKTIHEAGFSPHLYWESFFEVTCEEIAARWLI